MHAVSRKLIEMLSRLPKKAERVFITNVDYMYQRFRIQRKRAAIKLANPRLQEITFVTLRHWKGTMEYHKTKDILHVKGILGHKCIQSTMVYINLDQAYFSQINEDFTVRVAHNVSESCQLVEAGFEYVTGDYTDGGKIFRKRK
jgi:site-specific recombinase XerC